MYENPFTDFFFKGNKRKHANFTRSQLNKHLNVYCIRDEFRMTAVTTAGLVCLPLNSQ